MARVRKCTWMAENGKGRQYMSNMQGLVVRGSYHGGGKGLIYIYMEAIFNYIFTKYESNAHVLQVGTVCIHCCHRSTFLNG